MFAARLQYTLAWAILANAVARNITVPDTDEFKSETGMGITAQSGGHDLIIGKPEFLETKGVKLGKEGPGLITK